MQILDRSGGTGLALADYWADFHEQFWMTGDPGFWKIERQQFFQEPGYDTWEAFAKGNWIESLRLLEASRSELDPYHRRIDERGFQVRRVRVVEEPLTAYLQWELHALHVREQCGSGIRVVPIEAVAELETAGPVPEVYTLGTSVMYEAIYDDHGILESAVKYTDLGLISHWQRTIADLYEGGEPLADYFARAVAPLPPPTGERTR
jgi:hypothetical protein